MDITTKPLETETETPIKIQHIKPLSFTNGVLKRHPLPHIVTYKECLKNHAASLGGHAVDGCGEFMPSPNSNQNEPSSLKCAACGCHRNFHRRDPDEPPPNTTVIEYHPHHRHHPPPPPQPQPKHPISPNSTSPPPISSTYYPSVSHSQMLIAITSPPNETNNVQNGRKRFRTKFTQHQKDKMYEFAERVGWKMQKTDEDLTFDFCRQIGVDKGVLKVWMHNNKSTLGKRDTDFSNVNGSQNGFDHVTQNNTLNCVSDPHVVTANGSSSSS